MVIRGGGLAGTAAAIAARRAGAPVTVIEKSSFPRHKVCGEFLSPEVLPILGELGLRQAFLALQPALMRRAVLNFGGREKRFSLPEPAYGLSRFGAFVRMFLLTIAAMIVFRPIRISTV